MSTLSIVKKGLNNIAAPQVTGADYGTRSNEFWLFNQGGGVDYKFSYKGHDSSLTAYQKCAPLTAIINKKAQAYINGKTWILNTKGKAKGKEATGEVASKLRRLLAKPNPLQSWVEFEAQQYIYQQLFGFCILLPIKPVGFQNIDATSIWNIPPYMVDIQETEKLFFQSDTNGIIKQIILTYKNTKSILQAKDIYIFKDFTPSFHSLVVPESRICALEMPINNIIGAYESRNVLINYRGALGIISPDAKDVGGPVPMKEDDKETLQNDFLRYGLRNQQWKFIISNASVKWSQMSIPTRDLMLFEEIEDDIMRICDAYNHPYYLMSSAKGATFSNLNDAKKLLYQDATIPESKSMYEQWNMLFDLSQYDLKLDKDYSHIAALQEDGQKEAAKRKSLNDALQIEFYHNMITLNRWLELNGEDPLENELGPLYYYELVAMGIQFGKAGPTLAETNNQNSVPQT